MNGKRTHAMRVLFVVSVLIGGTVDAGGKARHLGPTGLFGAIANRQIEITKALPGSPADGKVHVGDVILGAGGTLFEGDADTYLGQYDDNDFVQIELAYNY